MENRVYGINWTQAYSLYSQGKSPSDIPSIASLIQSNSETALTWEKERWKLKVDSQNTFPGALQCDNAHAMRAPRNYRD